MSRDDEIRLSLRNAGVTQLVFGTTLAKEGAPALRELVVSKALVRPSEAKGVFVYPSSRTGSGQARKLFYLTAKELFLSGTTVYCLPLSRLVEAINSHDFDGEAAKVERVRMVFVLDFYEEGANFPLAAQDAAKLRAWVRNRFEAGNAVSFLSDTAPDRCVPWWPQSFLGFINDNTVICPV